MAQPKAVSSQAAVPADTPREAAISGRISTGALAPAAMGVASRASHRTGTGAAAGGAPAVPAVFPPALRMPFAVAAVAVVAVVTVMDDPLPFTSQP